MNTLESNIVEHPFFQTMRPEHKALLLENAREVKFNAGEIIFREGQPANRLFLVKAGKINLKYSNPSRAGTETVEAGKVLGWSWLFPPFQWHSTAEAVEPTCAIVLDGGHLLVTSEKNPEFGYALMKRITQILIHHLQHARGAS